MADARDERTARAGNPEDAALASCYDAILFDLDGVVYRGGRALEPAPEVVAWVRERTLPVAFVTNNASRTPADVAGRLRDFGIPAQGSEVVTSAQAAAAELRDRLPRGAAVFVMGSSALAEAVTAAGLRCVDSADGAAAVVQGLDPRLRWRDLAEGAYAVAAGALWVATNADLTFPSERGTAPGNGALVNAVAAAVGREPDVVAGKPYPALFGAASEQTHASRPLVVGDRLDTDIRGARGYGADSLLVMTGVTDLPALCRARAGDRPTYVAWTVDALRHPYRPPERAGDGWTAGDWQVRVSAGRMVVDRPGSSADPGLAAVTAACWDWQDHRDTPVQGLETVWPDG